jgi:hypothetical protein
MTFWFSSFHNGASLRRSIVKGLVTKAWILNDQERCNTHVADSVAATSLFLLSPVLINFTK